MNLNEEALKLHEENRGKIKMKFLAANWKMNHTVCQGLRFIQEFLTLQPPLAMINVILAPAFTSLFPFAQIIQKNSIPLSLCAQNCCEFTKGAYTGEVSAEMIAELGCQYVILGHSERRQIFHETNEIIFKKYQNALAASLVPILCFGETLSIYQGNNKLSYLENQLTDYKGLNPSILAYEPVWSIGTGLVPTIAEITAVITICKNQFPDTKILYGGSVTNSNIKEISQIKLLDGFLVGGASLESKSLFGLINSIVADND